VLGRGGCPPAGRGRLLTAEVLTLSEGGLAWLRVERGPAGVSVSLRGDLLYRGRAWPTSLGLARVWTDLEAFRADRESTLADLFAALDAATEPSLAADLDRLQQEVDALVARHFPGGGSPELASIQLLFRSLRARRAG
jgi:hypothetical protein